MSEELSAHAARGRALLELARASVGSALDGTGARSAAPESPEDPWLAEPGATFITLLKGEELRGCIGSLVPYRPLAEDVWENARAAAFHDPRFPALRREELPAVRFEVSLLAPAVPLPRFATEDEAIPWLRPGRDGLVLAHQGHSATFLPQVWEQLPEPKTFLAQLKRKAGLAPDFWSPSLRLSVYEVEKWKEPPPAP